MTKKVEKRQKAGRKSKYKKRYCEDIVKFFETKEKFPTIEGFCCTIFISKQTLHRWVEEFPEFSDAYAQSKRLQKANLINGGMDGKYNSTFTKFVAVNCTDMVEKTEVRTEAKITLSSSEIDGLSVEQVAEQVRELLN